MIQLLLLLLAETAQPTLDEVRYSECLKLAESDSAAASAQADMWLQQQPNDNVLGLACRGYAFANGYNFLQASHAFAEAARASARRLDKRQAGYWMQAANAAIADGNSSAALEYIDNAIKTGRLKQTEVSDAQVDRARAFVIASRETEAETALAQARKSGPENPAAWLLSATLARRMGKLGEAQGYISTASRLAPLMTEIALEAGNIALAAGDISMARKQYRQVIEFAPKSRMADTAKARLGSIDSDKNETILHIDDPSPGR
jgi:tetratricopeptide (TPR) repeat protein